MLFQRKMKPGDFMEAPQYNPKKMYVTDLYDIAYCPQYDEEFLTKRKIDNIGEGLYTLSANMLNNINYQLYQILGVRKYYGAEFLHGFSVEYNRAQQRLDYLNLDDTAVSLQYTKEMTRILDHVLRDWLTSHEVYILYEGEYVQYITSLQAKAMKHLKYSGRIVWIDY